MITLIIKKSSLKESVKPAHHILCFGPMNHILTDSADDGY